VIPVNISGTFSKDDRPNNGLETIAAELIKDELSPRVVVAIIVPHSYSKSVGGPLVPTVRFAAIEVVPDGPDAITVRDMLDRIRGRRDQAPVMRSLFEEHEPVAGHDPDGLYDGDGFARPEGDRVVAGFAKPDDEDEDPEDEDEDVDEPLGGATSPAYAGD